MTHPLEARVAAAQRAHDRFFGMRFKWSTGNCGVMIAWHLRAVGVPIKAAAKAGTYNSLAGAQRALNRLGYATLGEMADAHLERIAPAMALPSDIIEIPAEDRNPLGCLTIALGNGRVLGFIDVGGCAVLQPHEYVAAWRVPFQAG